MVVKRDLFFKHLRAGLHRKRLSLPQKDGYGAILDYWDGKMPECDDRWLAYILATAFHETAATMQPVRETLAASDDEAIAILDEAWKANRLPQVKSPYWRRDADGKSWLGRGLVQLTHRHNYEALSAATGIDLVASPERAMEMAVAVTILVEGMRLGSFTGKKLADVFGASSGDRKDWIKARRIVNGLDRAALVARYGRVFHEAIRNAK